MRRPSDGFDDFPWLRNERLLRLSSATAEYEPVNQQDKECADDRCDKSGAFSRFVPSDCPADETSKESSGDTEQDGDDAAAWILPWHAEG